jgi:signal peptidase II
MIQVLFVDFAVFNVADCCVVTGGILLAVYVLFFWEKLEGEP